MKIWFWNVPWAFALTGRLAEANTLFTACTSFRILRIACSSAFMSPRFTMKDFPPPFDAMLRSNST